MPGTVLTVLMLWRVRVDGCYLGAAMDKVRRSARLLQRAEETTYVKGGRGR